MKLNRLETHDRFLHYIKQSNDIAECVQSLIDQKPFGNHPFYIFAHARTIDLDEKIAIFQQDLNEHILNPFHIRKYAILADVPEKRLVWQPRLTKPKSQPNSMLFKAYPGTDNINILWILPPEEHWGQSEKGNVTEHDISAWSINMYRYKKYQLDKKEDDDLSDSQIDRIYQEISNGAKYQPI
jgi:hypothetical protein